MWSWFLRLKRPLRMAKSPRSLIHRACWLLAWTNFIQCVLVTCCLFNTGIALMESPILSVPSREGIVNAVGEDRLIEEVLSSGYLPYEFPLPRWAKGFCMPIENGKIPNRTSFLPGAPRNYRNGLHEGIDIPSPHRGQPVRAAHDGFILKILTEYQELPPPYRSRLLKIAGKLSSTPPEILDVLHGRRIIIDHGCSCGRWVTSAYSHLLKVEVRIEARGFVKRGSVIGYVGISGAGQTEGINHAHLHF